ncbi:hypothetical protein BD560DRAFT_426324 [Blakeslea trispora]|nr:hypothetical protein BD560DRAFT_426324 [Blakeslea trispora]
MNERQFNSPSPIIFPSASPTPKLYSTPTKKLPDTGAWQEIGYDSVPHSVHLPHERYTHILALPADMEDQEDFLSSIVSTQSSYTLASRSISPVTSETTSVENSTVKNKDTTKKSSITKFGSFMSRNTYLMIALSSYTKNFLNSFVLRLICLWCFYGIKREIEISNRLVHNAIETIKSEVLEFEIKQTINSSWLKEITQV